MGAVLIVLTIFGSIAAVIIAPFYFKNREQMALQETLRASYQAGHPVDPEAIEAIRQKMRSMPVITTPNPIRDIRGGIVWLAVAGGFMTFGYAVSYQAEEAFWPMVGIGAIPGFVGIALLLMGFVGLATQKKS